MRNKLYFYRNRAEFDQYYNDNNGNISGFEILDSKGILDDIQDTIIDITDLILYVRQEPLHRYSVRLNLNKLDTSNKLIINYQYVDEALNIFPLIFDEALPLYDKEEETLQRYNSDEVDIYKDKADDYFKYFIASLGVIFLIFVLLLVKYIVKKNKNKKKYKTKK